LFSVFREAEFFLFSFRGLRSLSLSLSFNQPTKSHPATKTPSETSPEGGKKEPRGDGGRGEEEEEAPTSPSGGSGGRGSSGALSGDKAAAAATEAHGERETMRKRRRRTLRTWLRESMVSQ